MGRCKRLSSIVGIILTLIISARTITLKASEVQVYTINPYCASWPTINDTGDMIGTFPPLQAHFAFDLSNLPSNATIISATFSAYFSNGSYTPSYRSIWYNSDDSWIASIRLRDPGNSIVADKVVGTFLHDNSPDEGYVWKTVTITYDGWANDIADGYISFMITGGQSGAVGLYPGETGDTWGVLKAPELTLTLDGTPLPIIVTSPNGGESFQTGSTQNITWYSSGTVGSNVKIELYKDDSYLRDIVASTANDGSFSWTVPSDLSAGTYKVKIIDISNSSVYDFSNSYFNIIDISSPSGLLQFKTSAVLIQENIGKVRVYVSRTDGSSGEASVNYSTSDGTALANSDYIAQSGTFYWGDGDTSDKYLDVSITNDTIYESEESFTISLSNASGASLGSITQMTIIIADNDSAPPVINPPQVDTLSPVNITSNTATLSGLLKNDGSDSTDVSCSCRFSYWKSGDEANTKTTDWQSGISQGAKFNAGISGLDPNTVYLFYAQASNSAGTVNASKTKFTTLMDSNIPPVVFNPAEPNTLLIQNFVKVIQDDPNMPNDNQGLITYVEGIGLNELDQNDVLYSAPIFEQASKIVSLVSMPEQKGKAAGFYELSKDARPKSPQDALLELSVFSPVLHDPNINSENSLKFWLAKNAFKGKTITIQKVSSDPNIAYPVWDVNEIISKNGRTMALSNLSDQKLNNPYAWFNLSTNRQILDIDDNGIVELYDYALLLMDVGKTGIYRNDIASVINKVNVIGIPDGKVNDIDVIAFITEYNKMYPGNPIPDPYSMFSENFESGILQDPFSSYGNSKWKISTDSYSGNYSVKSGNIKNNQLSVLEVNVNLSKDGNVSFQAKVSSELNFDKLKFYIDSEEKGSWSGAQDWKKMTYQISSGSHILKWEYIKDDSVSSLEDSAWIDEIIIQ